MVVAALAIRDGRSTYDVCTNNEQPATKLTEAQLSHLWAGQRLPASALVTREGVPLRVLHPGRRGRGAGPDFRDAILAPPSGPVLRGDIELHLRASDFRAHGHHRDPAYASIVLHLVFEDDLGLDTELAGGRSAPVVALAPWLRRRAEELASWLRSPRLWREPCAGVAARLGVERIERELETLGERRFAARAAALRALAHGEDAAASLYLALFQGVAYGGEPGAFERAAARLPWREIDRRIGAARPDRRVAAAESALRAAACLDEAPSPCRGRPVNRPERRLAGLAVLLVRHRAVFHAETPLALTAPARDLIASWSAPPAIGRSRAIELLTNAVLPWAAAYAAARGDAAGERAAQAAFARLPRPGRYGMLTFLEDNLRDGAQPLALDARRHQGLLALYKAECTQGGCGRCVFS